MRGQRRRSGEREEPARGFHELLGELDLPMYIATTQADGERAGCLVGFATQCSIEPPRYLICLSDKNRTYRVAQRAEGLAVHFVPASAEPLARLFGGETGDETDKFARCRWHTGPAGLPILEDCENWFAGRILDRQSYGDHVGHLLEPIEVAAAGSLREFRFHRARLIEPGHEA